jgi:hypothetical protein
MKPGTGYTAVPHFCSCGSGGTKGDGRQEGKRRTTTKIGKEIKTRSKNRKRIRSKSKI